MKSKNIVLSGLLTTLFLLLNCRWFQRLTVTHETHILFTGIASVHHQPGKSVDEIVIPVVKGHARAFVTDEEIPDHATFIAIDTNLYDVTVAPPGGADHPTKPHPGSHTIRLYVLDHQTLHVDGLTGSGATVSVETGESTCQHTVGNFYYVPRIGALVPAGSSWVGPTVESAFKTTAGELAAWVLSDCLQGFRGKKGPIGRAQRVAQVVDWKFTRPNDQLVLKNDRDADVFVVKARSARTPIAVVMGSGMKTDVEDVVDQKPPHHLGHDHHFDVYYDVYRSPSDRPIPYDGTTKCAADEPETNPWWPVWMAPNWSGVHLIGGFNCGPDQYP